MFVSGRVQGVFFRSSTQGRAAQLGLAGWVRNLSDGRVEVFAQGASDELHELRRWLEQGPPDARVEAVHVEQVEEDPSLRSFEVR